MQPHELEPWCEIWLGAAPADTLFEIAHLSQVVGLRLLDGREVVVKVRPAADRIHACVQVQRHLWSVGFPCPEPLAGPAPLGSRIATAEAFVPGGELLERGPHAPQLFAEALARLIANAPPPTLLPTLAPSPAWVWWDHHQPGIWPAPDDRDVDLNAVHEPAWLDVVGRRVRQRLGKAQHPLVVGHADWESQNVRWHDGKLHVVHDWDSVVLQSEAMIAGYAAAVFPANRAPLSDATVKETEAFLRAYERARGRRWSADEWEVCWAAGLWVRAFNAKKASTTTRGTPVLERLASEVADRLRFTDA